MAQRSPAGAVEARIQRTPGVCGGEACIRRTRIPVWLLESYRRQGMTDATLVEWYPQLSPDDLCAAWAYVKEHRAEVDRAVAESEAE